MSAAKPSVKRRGKPSDPPTVEKKRCFEADPDGDLDLASDVKGIISMVHQLREKAEKEGQKLNEEKIGSLASEIRSMVDEAKSKFEKDRHNFLKAISKSSKECESTLKNEYTNFQATYEKFSKDKAAHLQSCKEIFSKYEEEKDKLFARYEQQRKKEKSALAELEKSCADKIANAEEALKEVLKKKKQDNKSINFLRKSLSSFLESASDDDFGPDD